MATLEDRLIAEFYKYRTDYDGYTVYFENFKHYTKKEVRKIFSKYGAIRKIAQSEVYLCSHCFVAFVYEEGARKCVQGMKASGEIQLLVITRGRTRPPHLLNRYQGRLEKCPTAIPAGMTAKREQPASKIAHAQSAHGGHDETRIHSNIVEDDSMSQTPETNSSLDDIVDYNANCVDSECQMSCESQDLHPEVREHVIALLEQMIVHLPKVIQKVTMISASDDLGKTFFVPMKSRVPWVMIPTVSVEWIQAFPVFIANIHEICRVEFFMELFGIYEPLVVSKIKSVPELSMRYCWIYFRSAKCAESVQRIYDGRNVYGNSLIVMGVTGMEEN